MRDKLGRFVKGHGFEKEWIDKMKATKTTCPLVLFNCKNCLKDFYAKVYKRNKKRVFCCKECRNAYGVRTGIKLSDRSKKIMSERMTGSKNHSWRGGLNKGRTSLYKNSKYREWRNAIFERDKYTCQKCFLTGCRLEAHHIIPWAEDKDKWFNVSNGITLCKKCHSIITKEYMSKNWRNQYACARLLEEEGLRHWEESFPSY
jgi:hypothetical protein